MTIGIEAERANTEQKTGVEHYAKQLILHLAKIDSKNLYILYLRTKPQDWLKALPDNFKIKVIPFPIFWTQLRIGFEMLIKPVDILFIPASALPILHPKNSVVTIHDLAWKFYPESFTWFNRNFLEFSTRFAVKYAKKIIAVSESTKTDIVNFYKVDPKKVRVVHHGYEEVDVQKNESIEQLSKKLPEKFILFLSTLQPRKNLEGLIKAFAALKKENPSLPHKLVVVGKPGWKFGSILKTIKENSEIVVYLNYVSDSERINILKKAEFLVLPSFYEGFGMQILEAFALGVPVATSKVSSMPEVAGDAAAYFNPHDADDIKKTLAFLISNDAQKKLLKEKGSLRLKEFSWLKCAKQTLEVLTNNNDK